MNNHSIIRLYSKQPSDYRYRTLHENTTVSLVVLFKHLQREPLLPLDLLAYKTARGGGEGETKITKHKLQI